MCVSFASRFGAFALAMANDPWGVEEIVLVPLWYWAVEPALRFMHRLSSELLSRGCPEPWEDSLWRKAVAPLRQLSYAFLFLWTFDNGLALAAAAGAVLPSPASAPLLRGVPVAVYTAWLCRALLSVVEHWHVPPGAEQEEHALYKVRTQPRCMIRPNSRISKSAALRRPSWPPRRC